MIKTHYIPLILSLTTVVSFLFFLMGVNSWKFSYVGDEWPFYIFSRNIALNNFIANPFSFDGVFGEHSALGSVYQAIFLKVFGYSNFAWRLSNIVLIIPLTIFFYLWIKQSINKQVAFVSTLLLQTSFFLANFFKIGYINPQALVLFVINLYLANKCGRIMTKKYFFLLGVMLGFAFYIYIGPLFPFLIWPYFLPLLKKLNKRQILQRFIILLIGYILLFLPAVINFSALDGPASKTVFMREYHDNTQMLVNVLHNFLLFYKNYDYFYNHYVAGPYLDPITGLLALVGTGILLFKLRKLPYWQLLLTYISTCVVIGITSPYIYAPTTRGIFLLPFGFCFAGIGLYFLANNLKKINKTFSMVIALFLLFSIASFNFYQSQVGVFRQTGYSSTALVMKSLMYAQAEHHNNVYLLLSENNHFRDYYITDMKQAYGLTDINFLIIRTPLQNCSQIRKSYVVYFQYDPDAIRLLSELNCASDYKLYKLNPSIFL